MNMNCDGMMEGSAMMMIGMGLVWLLIVVALLFGISALFKYLRS